MEKLHAFIFQKIRENTYNCIKIKTLDSDLLFEYGFKSRNKFSVDPRGSGSETLVNTQYSSVHLKNATYQVYSISRIEITSGTKLGPKYIQVTKLTVLFCFYLHPSHRIFNTYHKTPRKSIKART
jgi:hypothetical protein